MSLRVSLTSIAIAPCAGAQGFSDKGVIIQFELLITFLIFSDNSLLLFSRSLSKAAFARTIASESPSKYLFNLVGILPLISVSYTHLTLPTIYSV